MPEADDRAKKEMQRRMQERQLELQKREILKRFLTPEAYERMMNVRISNPEVYNRLVELVISMVQGGSLPGKINEEQVKDLLTRLTTREQPKLEFKHK
ncbi:MAG: hypothetical protein KGH49_03705 [Candidatus Micrarchaeota archaeon]|nr:hypothetical protein [Candidatus Micrarchaeota archaeon]